MIKVKRLFISTGNLSLLNILTIIMEEKQQHFEDTLLIHSFQASQEFIIDNINLASLHSFHNILFVKSLNGFPIEQIYRLFDIVYITLYTGNIREILEGNIKLPESKFFFIDEGTSYALCGNKILKNGNLLYANNYLDKFNLSAKHTSPEHISSISKIAFNQVCKNINKRLFFSSNINNQEKSVLVIGNYIFYSILGNEKTIEYYHNIFNIFNFNGFKIYFKPHPREMKNHTKSIINSFIDKNNIIIIDTNLPLEACNYNFSCIAGSFSNLLITFPHFRGVPSIHFSFDAIYKKCPDLILCKCFYIVEHYTPNINLFLDYLHLPAPELNDKIKNIYHGWMYKRKGFYNDLILQTILNSRTNKFFRLLKSIYNIYS